VVAVATLLLLVGLANLARGSLAIASALRLPALPMAVSWEYLATGGIVRGLALCICSFGLAGFYRWARVASLIITSAFQVDVWVNHLLFDASDYARQTWPRDLALTVLFLGFVFGVLAWPSVCREFRSSRESAQ
jgi:hypothetical protein